MANRTFQVIKYGWKHSKLEIGNNGLFNRLKVFFDILYCYRHYKMWSNEYIQEHFYLLPKAERVRIGLEYRKKGMIRDAWQDDFRSNRKFLIKYSDKKYEIARLRQKRNQAYAKRFNAGPGLMVEYDVNVSRQHYLNGTIKIGKNVLLAKNVFVDYSGEVEIKDDVQITNGAIIETHYHPFHSDWQELRSKVCPTKLVIEEGAVIGSRAIIMPTCHYIGKCSRIGAGAVVTHDVPDYSIAVGVPAMVVRTMAH